MKTKKPKTPLFLTKRQDDAEEKTTDNGNKTTEIKKVTYEKYTALALPTQVSTSNTWQQFKAQLSLLPAQANSSTKFFRLRTPRSHGSRNLQTFAGAGEGEVFRYSDHSSRVREELERLRGEVDSPHRLGEDFGAESLQLAAEVVG